MCNIDPVPDRVVITLLEQKALIVVPAQLGCRLWLVLFQPSFRHMKLQLVLLTTSRILVRRKWAFDITVSVLGAKKFVHCNRMLVMSELAVNMLECGFSQHLAKIHGSTLGPGNNE